MAGPALLDVLRWSRPALRAQSAWRRCTRGLRHRSAARTRGRCPLCGGTTFVHVLDNAREDPLCLRCGSVPRQRALAAVLASLDVPLATAAVHEASPSLATFEFFGRHCRQYVASYFVPGVAAGARIGAFRCVDLGAQPFAAGAFDLVVTQDVLEHVPDPARALREIHRTLRPGGRHVFTVPRMTGAPTRARAELRDGSMHLLLPAQYHGDPTTRDGSLVVTDWGMDLERLVADRASTSCLARTVCDAAAGIPLPVEVFVAPCAP